jgi:hypothetical protein
MADTFSGINENPDCCFAEEFPRLTINNVTSLEIAQKTLWHVAFS